MKRHGTSKSPWRIRDTAQLLSLRSAPGRLGRPAFAPTLYCAECQCCHNGCTARCGSCFARRHTPPSGSSTRCCAPSISRQMVLYRRNRVPGGTYFFTITLRDRSSSILVDRVDDLRKVLSSVMREHPFKIEAMVVLPEHLHALWVLPPGDDDYPGRVRLMKSRFTHSMVTAGVLMQRNAKGEYDLWQRRYWEHTIRDEQDFERHVDYIHWNPVKHGYVARVADWPHSTFHHFVAKGVYPLNWACGQDQSGSFGE